MSSRLIFAGGLGSDSYKYLQRFSLFCILPNSFIAPDVSAAMLVERTMAKKSFGNLTLLLCKTQGTFCLLFWHQHGRLITSVQIKEYSRTVETTTTEFD